VDTYKTDVLPAMATRDEVGRDDMFAKKVWLSGAREVAGVAGR